jgi:hypothetical protein
VQPAVEGKDRVFVIIKELPVGSGGATSCWLSTAAACTAGMYCWYGCSQHWCQLDCGGAEGPLSSANMQQVLICCWCCLTFCVQDPQELA